MAERTKYLTEATLFAPAANKWASDTGILNNNGGLLLLRASNNLSDIQDTVTARINLGIRIGADVQPYSERLTAYAGGAAPSAFSLAAMGKANAIEWRDFLGAGTVTSVTISGGSTGLLFLNGTTTGAGTSTLSGVLGVPNGGTGVSNLAAFKANLNLNNVDNTADIAKPISSATQSALDTKFDKPIGSVSQYIRGDGTLAAFPTSGGGTGTVTSITLSGGTTGLSFLNPTTTTSGTSTLTGTLALANGGTGVTTVAALRTLVSINNVDNTSDANKPISTATQTALDRRLRIPASMTAGATLELPTPSGGKAIAWNAQGTALVNIDPGSGGSSTPGTVYVTVDVFDSDGTSRVFTLSRNPISIDNISVTIGGVSQTPSVDYTLSGSILTLTTTVPLNEKIVVRSFSIFVVGDLEATQINTDPFDGNIIPDNANAQIALQALETALASVQTTLTGMQTTLARKVFGPSSLGTLTLPNPEAGKVIGWNNTSDALINILPGSGSGDGTAVSYADVFTGNGSQTNFTLSFTPGRLEDVSASVGGVDQVPGVAYTLTSGNVLSFTSAVPNGARVVARYNKSIVIDELTASDIVTTNFSGSTIPNNSSVQEALQALETAVENGTPGSGTGVARSHVDIFTADGTTTRFPLDVSPSYLDNLFVEVGGIVQVPTTNYTWDSDTNELVITPAVPSGETIVARYLDALVIDLTQLGKARVQKFTSVLNQTDYVLDYDPIDLDEVQISVGGIDQSPDDQYTLVLPNIIRFTPAPDPDLNIVIRYGSHRTIGNGGSGGIATTDRFTGDGVQTQFTLSENPGSLDNLLVIIDTVIQTPTDDYLWTSGRTLTFTTAPEDDAIIVVRYGVVNTGGTPTASVKYDNFTSDGTTTVYTLSVNPGSINNLHVTFTGLTQSPTADYTFTAPYTLTLTEAPEAGTAIQVKIGGTLPIGVTQADLITTDDFTGTIIPNGSSVQQALQALETNVSTKAPNTVASITAPGLMSISDKIKSDGFVDLKAIGAKGDGVVNDTVALQNAIGEINNRGGGRIYASKGKYKIRTPLVLSSRNIKIEGDGPRASIFIEDNLSSGQYILNILQNTADQGTVIRDIGFQSMQDSVANGLYVEYSQTDGTSNRAPQRCVIDNLEMIGNNLSQVGFVEGGFRKGITLKNVTRPLLTNVNLGGVQTAWSPTGVGHMEIGVELISNAAPTDAVFRNLQIYCAGTGLYCSGHWEGLSFDTSHFINNNFGIYIDLPVEQFPWLSVQNCHINSLSDNITTNNMFDVKIMNNLFYKFDMIGSSDLTPSTGLKLTKAHRATILGNTFNNSTKDSGNNIAYDAISLFDTNDALIADNVMAGCTHGLTLVGNSNRNKYRSGIWTDVPTFGETPVEYRNIGSGSGNVSS